MATSFWVAFPAPYFTVLSLLLCTIGATMNVTQEEGAKNVPRVKEHEELVPTSRAPEPRQAIQGMMDEGVEVNKHVNEVFRRRVDQFLYEEPGMDMPDRKVRSRRNADNKNPNETGEKNTKPPPSSTTPSSPPESQSTRPFTSSSNFPPPTRNGKTTTSTTAAASTTSYVSGASPTSLAQSSLEALPTRKAPSSDEQTSSKISTPQPPLNRWKLCDRACICGCERAFCPRKDCSPLETAHLRPCTMTCMDICIQECDKTGIP